MQFPYYDFVDRAAMYKVGSLFYAIYFLVSFPMFYRYDPTYKLHFILVLVLIKYLILLVIFLYRIDEKADGTWDLPRVAVDALGAAMLVTIILDLWRLYLGPIVPIPHTNQCIQPGLPWFPGHVNDIWVFFHQETHTSPNSGKKLIYCSVVSSAKCCREKPVRDLI